MCLEVGIGLLSFGFVIPCLEGMTVDTGLAKRLYSEFHGSVVRNGIAAINSNLSDSFDFGPEVGEFVVRVPSCFEQIAVALQIGSGHGAIFVVNMCEQLQNGDVGIAKGVVL